MKFCQNCGKQIDDNARFCVNCGQQQTAPVQPSQTRTVTANGKRLHCPVCKSMEFTPVVETSTTGGSAVHTPLTRRVGVSTYTMHNIHREYWMCRSCGHKFRNLENLKEELVKETKRASALKVCSLVFGISTVLLGLLCIWQEIFLFFALPLLLLIGVVILFVCVYFSTKKKVESMATEKAYLEKNCFD